MKSRMRQRRAAAHSRRAKLFALEQLGEDKSRQHVDGQSGPPRQLFQELLFVRGGDVGRDVGGGEEVGNFHRNDITSNAFGVLKPPSRALNRERGADSRCLFR